jgi:hypothetical protein
VTRGELRFRAAVAALAIGFVALTVVRWPEPLALDQGLFACFTRWVPRGWLPYRDLFDSKPPLYLYSYALARLYPGELTHGIWLLEAAWLAATMKVAFLMGRRVWDRWAGLAAAALLFVAEWAPGWGGWWSRAQADEFVALPLLGAAWLAWLALDREKLALWAGVLTGVAGLFKIPAMAVAGAWPLTWLLVSGLRPSIKRTLFMAAGLLAPWALMTGWFAAHGAFGDFVYGTFVYQRHIAAYIAPPWSEVIGGFFKTIVVEGALPLAAAIAGLVLAERRERAWLAPWIALTAVAVMLERQLAGYHYLLVLPGLALAGGFGIAKLLRARRTVALAGLAALIALGALETVRWSRAYSDDGRVLTGVLPRERYLLGFPGGVSPAVEEQAAEYLRTHSAPSDKLLVWGLGPGIYALADRAPVGRYPFHKLLYTDAPLSRMIGHIDEHRAELMTRLRADKPPYVLVGRGDANGFEPQSSFQSMMAWPELRDLLHDQYAPETEIGRFVVLRRK